MENTETKTATGETRSAMMRHLKVYTKQDVLSLTRLRRFETKLGEQLTVINDAGTIEETLKTSTAKFVLFGIPEDLGAKGNFGIGGADTLWIPFLQSLLNIQSNDFFDGGEILLIGHFDFGNLRVLGQDTVDGLRTEAIIFFKRLIQLFLVGQNRIDVHPQMHFYFIKHFHINRKRSRDGQHPVVK